jgi:TonB family protein
MNSPLRFFLPAGLLVASCGFAAAIIESPEDNTGIGINQADVVIYPSTMLLSGISIGEARVVISVDAEGRLTDALVIAYTDASFAETATAALKRWTYEPAQVHGHARASRAEVLFTFSSSDGITVSSIANQEMAKRLMTFLQEQYAFQACQLRDLDRIPTPLQVVAPALAKATLTHGTKRTVTVEFYIDQEGRVRVPAIEPAETDDVYAAAAVAAVEKWRFEPPLRKGRPVLVLARQDFTFVPRP